MKKIIALMLFSVLIISCSKTNDQQYFDQGNNFIKEKNFKEAIKNFETLVNEFPDSKLAPKSLMQIASLYESHLVDESNYSKSYQKALDIYNQIFEKYPDSEEAPIALFQCGFIYDNELKNYDEATKKYNLFLQKYPDHKYAAIVKQSLDIMGMDPEDIINKKLSNKN